MQLNALIALLMEWVVLVTTAAPLVMHSARFAGRLPRLAIAIWFTSFAVAGACVIAALAIAAISVLDFWRYLEMQKDSPERTGWAFALSFVPWLLLALSGVTLALINQSLEPLIAHRKVLSDSLENLPSRQIEAPNSILPRKVELHEIQLRAPLAFSSSDSREHHRIVVSSGLTDLMNAGELAAVIRHEIAHINQGHQRLKSFALFVARLTPTLVASKLFQLELNRLSEFAADDAVVSSGLGDDLLNALTKICEARPSQLVSQRLARLATTT